MNQSQKNTDVPRKRSRLIALRFLRFIAAGLLLYGAPAAGQGFERVEALRELSRNKVLNLRLSSRWSDDGERLTYRLETPDGEPVFFEVDPASGQRRQLDGASEGWEPGTLEARPFSRRIRSRNSATETEVTFVNQTDQPVSLSWLETGGGRQQYATIEPGASHDQHTFAGHAWLVEHDDEPLAVFVAEPTPAVANITGLVERRDRPDDRPGRRGPDTGESPDGRWQVRFEDHNVVLADTQSDQTHQLTDDGTADDSYDGPVHWSPDSRYFVVEQTEAPQNHPVYIIESSPEDQLQPKLQEYDYLKPGDRIAHPRPRLFDAAELRAVPIDDALFPQPWSIDRYHWAADSSRLFFLYNQRGHQTLRLVGVDAATGEAVAVIDEHSDTFIDYADKLYLHHLDDTDEVIWMSERDGWNHLYLVNRATGDTQQLTSGEWVVRGVENVDDDKRELLLRVMGIHSQQDPYHVHYARLHLDTGELTILTEGDGTHAIEFSPDGRFFIDTWSRVDMPPVHELRRSDDGSLVCELARADASALLDAGWQTPQPFVAKGRDGETDIYGVIYVPTDFDPGHKYPVVESIYAGPQGQFVPKSFSAYRDAQGTAEVGFVTVQIDGMGTNWRSKAFHDVAWKNLKDAGLPDRIAWMKAAAETRPWMDLSRVGVYGVSAGAQSAMRAVLDYADFYKAAAADCGCHDNRMDKIWWNELWMGYPVDESYEKSSNVVDAHKLGGALLLTVGELDRNVDPASTMQVVDALIEADKDFELVIFPGRGHGAGGSPYGRRRMYDFFTRHLIEGQ